MKFKTQQIVYTAFFIALGLVLPIGFHMVRVGGPVFLPMHLPVFLAGIVLGYKGGLITGIITPLLSSFLTGMPPLLPMSVIMTIELALYGGVTGFLIHNRNINIYLSLLISMVIGRSGAGLTVWVLIHILNFTRLPDPLLFIWGAIIQGVPGIIIQITLLPVLYYLLSNHKFNHIREVKSNV